MIDRSKEFSGMSVTFNTTEDCNLACKYCYEVNKKKKTLKLEDAKKFIDLLLTEEDPLGTKGQKDEWIQETGIILDFIGGDALMNVGLVEQIVAYFQRKAWELNHKYKDRWRISISTNGTLFHLPEVKNFMNKYGKNCSIGVSIDGVAAIHDLNRVYVDGRGSLATIIEQWPWYKDWCFRSGVELATKSTLNLDSIPYITESVKFLYEDLGINMINMNFIMENMNPQESDIKLLDLELEKLSKYLLEHRHEIYISLFDKNMSIGMPMKEDKVGYYGTTGRCGSGAMPSLGINGKIYPCFRYLPHTAIEERDDFNIGDVANGFDKKYRFEEVRKASRIAVSPPECLECPIESMCPYCIGGCYAEFGEFKRTTYICNIAKVQDKWAKLYWREYDKLENTRTENAYYPTNEEYLDGKRKGL